MIPVSTLPYAMYAALEHVTRVIPNLYLVLYQHLVLQQYMFLPAVLLYYCVDPKMYMRTGCIITITAASSKAMRGSHPSGTGALQQHPAFSRTSCCMYTWYMIRGSYHKRILLVLSYPAVASTTGHRTNNISNGQPTLRPRKSTSTKPQVRHIIPVPLCRGMGGPFGSVWIRLDIKMVLGTSGKTVAYLFILIF